MRGFLHTKPKIDPAEWALIEARMAARLDEMFGDVGASDDEELEEDYANEADGTIDMRPSATTGPAEPAEPRPEPWRGGPRPPIIVAGHDPIVVPEPSAPARMIGVMASTDDGLGGGWTLPVGADVPPVPEGAAAAESVASVAEPTPGAAPAGPARTHRGTAAPTPKKRTTRAKTRAIRAPVAHCPYCAVFLDPAPTTNRRCDRCRQRIIVKRVDGVAVYLTEAAVAVFDSERRRLANAGRFGRERERWLRLASAAGAPAARQEQLTRARLTADVVAAARALYLTTVDRAFRAAKRDREWDEASRSRREKAAVLYRVAGSPVPPPAEIVALFREGVAAELRGIAEISRDAELVGGGCCDTCRADDRILVRITQETRAPRLPHPGCPKGLCRCHWDLAARDRRTMQRYLRRRAGTTTRVSSGEPVPTS